MNLRETVAALCRAESVTGAGSAANRLVAAQLSVLGADVRTDALGNVIGTWAGPDPILLDAHMDQIGLVITASAGRGFFHVEKVGGTDRRTLIGKPVIVYGAEPVHGVISSVPPHLATKEDQNLPEWSKILLDTGNPDADSLIFPGDPVITDSTFRPLLGTRVAAAALDNRAGVAAVLRAMELVRDAELPRGVIVQFSVQEEFRGAGAVTGAYQADVRESLTVDVSFAKSAQAADIRAELGKGPMIGVAASLNRKISTLLRKLAEKGQIPYQMEGMGGRTGTNADFIAVSRGGVRVGLISIPQRNMHTGVEVVDLNDIEQTAQLLAAYLRVGGLGAAEKEVL